MSDLGRMLLVAAAVLALAGLAMIVAERFGIPRLPGDVTIRRESFTLHFPIVTCIVASVVLTLLINLVLRGR